MFLYYYSSSLPVQDVIEDKATGSTKQKELNLDVIKNIQCRYHQKKNRIG